MTNSNLFLRSARHTPARSGAFPLQRLLAVPVLALTLALGVLAGGAASVHAQDSPAAARAATVNINTADADTLASTLRGVGNARALEIVRYRESYGPFTSVDELTEVKGIGQSTLDENRALITLE